jgi:lysophospholipase L1-like esterase
MTVPNATTARHSYIITKEDGESSTTFTVYLDGIKWKTVTTNFKIEFSNSNTGIQFGSDFGGTIRSSAGYSAVSDNTGILNVLRVYGRVITPAEIAAYASTFPYVSPSGSSSRTFAAAENWIDTTESSTVWDNSSEADSGTPTEGASVTVTASADTTITVNFAVLTEYESLTINGSSVTFTPASASSGAIKVTGMTVVGTAVTNVYGAVDMAGGPMTITEDGDITFDCSAYDISDIYTTTDVNLTGDVDENSTRVHLIAPSAAYRTASLVYTSRHYVMRVAPDHEPGSDVYYKGGYWGDNTFAVTNASGAATIVLAGDTVVIPAYYEGASAYFGATLPANVAAIRVEKNFTFESGVDDTAILGGATVTVADGCTLSFATTWHNLTLGAVTFDGPGGVSIPTLTSTASIAGAVSGTATLSIAGTVGVPSIGSISNAVTGAGRIVFEGALPAGSDLLTSLQDSISWTGTVELKNYTQTTEIDAHKIINLGNYGNSSSTVALNGVTSTMYTGNNSYPDVTLGAIEIGEGGWSDNDGLSYTVDPLYTANLTGNGTITVKTGNKGTVRFVGNHTFAGSVAFGDSTGKQVAFMRTSSDTLPTTVTNKAIIVAGRLNMSIASGKTWTADAIKLDGSLTVLTDEKKTATSVEPTAYLDGATITTTVDGEAGTTTYVTDEVTQISDNQASLGAVTVSEPKLMTGSGGAYMSSLTINDGATLTYDPVITPLRVESAPVFNGSGKLKLAARYAGVTRGKFHLVSYPSSASVSGTLTNLVDDTSFSNASYTVTEETVGSYKQLVLKVGDYDTNAKAVSIAQFGDSITEGIWRSGYRGTPNYRIPLMQLLEAYGYRPEARGYRSVGSTDANGVPADDNYKWHTGISAQRIYTGMTGTYLRAGFMESIEAHLEQVGVTDIITLKIGTNDSIGNETADNMFEGWSNLVWKIVRMRPASKIVVCAPVKIRSGENNAPGLRTKIAEYVAKTAAQGGFPDGQVTMINGIDIVTDNANYYLTDDVHPNWNGHLQLANAWLPAVTNAIESMTARATVGYSAQTFASVSAEAVNALADYRAGYVKLATFTNFNAKVSAWDENPYVSVNDTYKDMPMRRVAYFVARKTKASPDTRYVWVDMDADETSGTTLAAFGMPTNAAVNGVVNNLHIYSNSSAIENVAPTVSGVRGTLMRTEKGVDKANGISTDLAPDGPYGFDWNDSINGSGSWGVMNMARIFDGATPTDHRKLLAAQMLFDFNGFNGERQNALGLGNFAVHGPYNTANGSVDHFNLNWTFTTSKDDMPTMDATALETGVIEIWGKPTWGTIFSVY